MVKLTTEQKEKISSWAAEGASLNQIQDRLRDELGITITYLEARLLLAEYAVSIKQPKKEEPVAEPEQPSIPDEQETTQETEEDASGSSVSVKVDQIAQLGTMVSGSVTFSDGKSAIWYLDQYGQLGMKAPEAGYQPPPADIPAFQNQLGQVLRKMGY